MSWAALLQEIDMETISVAAYDRLNAEVQGRGAGLPAERPSATTGSAAAGPEKGD